MYIMELRGEQIIAGAFSKGGWHPQPKKEGGNLFAAKNPVSGKELEPFYYEATAGEVDRAFRKAREAF